MEVCCTYELDIAQWIGGGHVGTKHMTRTISSPFLGMIILRPVL